MEILVVVAIVAVLSVILVVMLRIDRQTTRDARRVSDIRQMQVALEMHFNDESRYPAQVQGGAPIKGATSGIIYMLAVPGDPLARSGRLYEYASEEPYGTYAIRFVLERGIGSLLKGVHIATPEGMQ